MTPRFSLFLCLPVLSCVRLCDPMDCSPPGFSVHGIFQARIVVWVAISYSRESSWPRDWTESLASSALAGSFFTTEPPGKPYSQVTDLVISALIDTFAALRFINFWPVRLFKYKCNKIIQFFILSFPFENLCVITISGALLLLLLLSHSSRVRLCSPIDGSPPGSAVPGILH